MEKNLMERAPEIVEALREEARRHPDVWLYRDAADLIEQMTAEAPNDPLTLDELRGMDREAVWAGNEKEPQHFQWFLVDCRSAYKPFILINLRNNLMWQYIKSPAHPNGWTAYRRKPEGGGE